MKTNGTKKDAEKKVAATKSVPPKAKQEKAGEGRILGKTSGETRARFMLNLLIANRKEKLPDAELLKKAQKEFGADLVPGESKNFTVAHRRYVANRDRKLERRGLKKSDPEFVRYDKPEEAV